MKPLAEITVKKSKVKWRHSLRFSEAHAATLRNMTPSAFRALSWEDQAEMIAHDRDIDKMSRHEAEEEVRLAHIKNASDELKRKANAS